MSNESFTEQATERLARLRKRCADPGFRAALRHWLSDAGRPRAYQALMDLRGTLDDEDFNTVAALYAYHPDHSDNGGTLGHLCRSLSAGLSTFEGRFKRLLLCDAEELRQRLQPVILAARAEGVPVDYRRLYLDLRSWDHDFYGDRVRKDWAQDFWGQAETPPAKPEEVPA
jgi:CRISPR type I-E-associated protein CasB/Cse2